MSVDVDTVLAVLSGGAVVVSVEVDTVLAVLSGGAVVVSVNVDTVLLAVLSGVCLVVAVFADSVVFLASPPPELASPSSVVKSSTSERSFLNF